MGAGAVGSFYGAMLARAGHAVTLIGRPAHVQAIERDGLRLEMAGSVEAVRAAREQRRRRRCAVPTWCCAASSPPTPKPWRAQMAPHLGDAALRAEPAERRRQRRDAGAARALPRRAGGGVRGHGDGRARATCSHFGRGDLVIGAMPRRPQSSVPEWPALQALVELFARAEVPVRIVARRGGRAVGQAAGELRLQRDLRAGAAAVRRSWRRMPAIRELQHDVVREVVAVAAADGVTLPLAASLEAMAKHRRRRCRRSCRPPRRTWRDASPARSTTSTASSRGAARELGVATPANQALHALVKLVEVRLRPTRMMRVGSLAARSRCPTHSRRRCASSGWPGAGPLVGAPLTGGVSSDIWRIDTARGPVCAKRALPKLRVAADWRAPIERNRYEARWMQVAAAARPGCAPRVLGQHPRPGRAGDELPAPASTRCGSSSCATARPTPRRRARSAARWRASMRTRRRGPSSRPQFATDAIFFDIRLEPYLLATAQRHADLADRAAALVAADAGARASRWCTATSARRTSSSAPTGRCCWMPNARGGATRRSTSPSASTTCC